MLRKSKSNSKSINQKSESSRRKQNILFGIAESEEDHQMFSDCSQEILLSSVSSLKIKQRQPIYTGDDGR